MSTYITHQCQKEFQGHDIHNIPPNLSMMQKHVTGHLFHTKLFYKTDYCSNTIKIASKINGVKSLGSTQ